MARRRSSPRCARRNRSVRRRRVVRAGPPRPGGRAPAVSQVAVRLARSPRRARTWRMVPAGSCALFRWPASRSLIRSSPSNAAAEVITKLRSSAGASATSRTMVSREARSARISSRSWLANGSARPRSENAAHLRARKAGAPAWRTVSPSPRSSIAGWSSANRSHAWPLPPGCEPAGTRSRASPTGDRHRCRWAVSPGSWRKPRRGGR